MRVLFLPKYDRLGASSRLRIIQYIPSFQSAGILCRVESLLPDAILQNKYKKGKYRIWDMLCLYTKRLRILSHLKEYDIVFIEKEALPWFPVWIELFLLRNTSYVLDYDDAVFHGYDMHSSMLVRSVFGKRLDSLMAKAKLVIGGNSYLSNRGQKAGAQRVETIPTVIDLDRYKRSLYSNTQGIMRIVWIGSPSTARYLNLLQRPLQQLAHQYSFILCVIGAESVSIPGVNIEIHPWSEPTEVDLISACHIGVMPLENSNWEKGKCGYKLIQYMACGLPVVASSIGANIEIVEHEKSGFLVQTEDEWIHFLGKLLASSELRYSMGLVGRLSVEKSYCLQVTAPKLVKLLNDSVDN